MNQTKALIASKTFQLAAIQAIAGVVVVFATAYPQAGWLLVVKSVIDILLRIKTENPIGSIF